jgi:hypothetical protein
MRASRALPAAERAVKGVALALIRRNHSGPMADLARGLRVLAPK